MHFKPGALAQLGLPEIGYPVPFATFDRLMGHPQDLPFPEMLHGLQQASSKGDADWQTHELAMARLAELIAPDDDNRSVVDAGSEEWWVEIGPVDLSGAVVTIQRRDLLVAAFAPREDGRLRLAAYRPLDGKSASSIMALSRRSKRDDGMVSLHGNNWDYAKAAAAGMGQVYADSRGQSYLSWWGLGIGHQFNGNVLTRWEAMAKLPPMRPAQVAIELGVAYAYSSS
jgi:hypothetical protein